MADTAVADTAVADTAVADTAVADTAVADTAVADTAVADTADTAVATVSLRIENYLAWCEVTVNGGTPSTAATQTLTFPAGTVVNLLGDTAGSAFVWLHWRGTAGDTTSAHDTAMSTTVTVNADKVIQACCPLTSSPTTPCPAP